MGNSVKKRVVLYHGGSCADGYGSAWACWKSFQDDALYIPVQYGQPVPEEAHGVENLYIVDFSYPLETMRQIVANCGYLCVIDHHASAEADLKAFAAERGEMGDLVFDLRSSGAVLTWTTLHRSPVPRLLSYVEDRDLWLWRLADSKAISASIASRPWTFEEWDDMEDHLRNCTGTLNTEGHAILRYQGQLVERHVKAAKLEHWEDDHDGVMPVPVVNATCLQSEIGHALCEAFPNSMFSASYYDRPDGKRCYSLRSIGEFHVGNYAKRRGGGGHRNASGFEED